MDGDTGPEGRPRRDLALYERLIGDGIAEADGRGGAIDHVTARRMSIWLLSRSQDPVFMRGLILFARSGAITPDLAAQLRMRASSPGYPHRRQAVRLLQYTLARGTDLGPVGTNFAALCDQIDQADTMLAGLRDRARQDQPHPQQAPPGTSRQQPIAMARHDPASRTVTLILDDTTANMAIHALAVSAADREAHTREVQQYSQTLPDNSYGKSNRETIAARETRIAARLRAIEHAYRTALDSGAAPAFEPFEVTASADKVPDHELEME